MTEVELEKRGCEASDCISDHRGGFSYYGGRCVCDCGKDVQPCGLSWSNLPWCKHCKRGDPAEAPEGCQHEMLNATCPTFGTVNPDMHPLDPPIKGPRNVKNPAVASGRRWMCHCCQGLIIWACDDCKQSSAAA